MEDYSALKRKEILTIVHYKNATIWINLENIMLSERSQSQKDRYCMVPLHAGVRSERQKVEWWLPGTGERGEKGLLFKGYRALL